MKKVLINIILLFTFSISGMEKNMIDFTLINKLR